MIVPTGTGLYSTEPTFKEALLHVENSIKNYIDLEITMHESGYERHFPYLGKPTGPFHYLMKDNTVTVTIPSEHGNRKYHYLVKKVDILNAHHI